MSDNYDALRERGFSDRDVEILPVYELLDCIDQWVGETRTPSGLVRGGKSGLGTGPKVNKGVGFRANHAF
jgi:hypothetical protein